MKKVLTTALSLLMATVCCVSAAAEVVAVNALMGKQGALHTNLSEVKVTKVTQITGEDSENKTQSRFQVWGTDLGSMAEMGGKVYMFCGDTFSTPESEGWRSNVLFVIEDDDPSDGLTITDAITDTWGNAKELLLSRKNNSQVTVIPTNIFAVDQTLYCIYMSVTKWGTPGSWDCDYAGLAISRDEGKTWARSSTVKWPGNSNFIQTANARVGDTMYIWGIPSGRFGGVALMKCDVYQLEDMEAYAYYTGMDAEGNPVWVQGSDGIAQAAMVVNAPCGEISVSYNPYLGNYVMTCLNEKKHAVVMREGVMPWGPWGEEAVLASAKDYPALYGGYMLDRYQEEHGRVFYFAMSQFFPVYNILWMRAELPDVLK